ncbi:transient-receptor-potential-like protein [Saccoglossus kowalevskii]|uniref:Short transient receptor potential channel 7-like n=1 Tax=Saccoglossus kowalevskii TaxID=10224 RepID=A0ABM0MZS8_SACKO|nr:PREDICTED: short transient receptor potential channel 7-like [Saccoglossus kowalevskii]
MGSVSPEIGILKDVFSPENEGNINASDEKLVHLVEEGNVEQVEAFIKEARDLDLNLGIIKNSISTTGLLQAAKQDHFLMIKLLLDHGAKLLKIDTITNKEMRRELNFSLQMTNFYHGLSSPSYISLTSDDPLRTTLQLIGEIHKLSDGMFDNEYFRGEYNVILEKLENFAVELLSKCTTNEEVLLLLHGKPNPANAEPPQNKLLMLEKAIEVRAKKFVADSRCQHVLASIWYQGYEVFRSYSLTLLYALLVYGLLQPVTAVLYLILPSTRFSKSLKNLSTMIMMHFFAQVGYIILYLCIINKVLSSDMTSLLVNGPLWVLVCVMYMLYGVGMTLKLITDMKLRGILNVLTNMYGGTNMAVVVCIYDVQILLYLVCLCFEGDSEEAAIVNALFRCMCCTGLLNSCAQLLEFMLLNSAIGPMLIGLKCVIKDSIRFLVVFFVFQISCSLSLHYLYYDGNLGGFSESLLSTCWSLLWSLFGIHEFSRINSGESLTLGCSLNKTDSSTHNSDDTQCRFYTTQTSLKIVASYGMMMYALYCGVVILGLLNIYIAMMTNTYAKIYNDNDIEWVYACTSVTMQYSQYSLALPPPYNVFEFIKNCVIRSLPIEKQKTTRITVIGVSDYDKVLRRIIYEYLKQKFEATDNQTNLIACKTKY